MRARSSLGTMVRRTAAARWQLLPLLGPLFVAVLVQTVMIGRAATPALDAVTSVALAQRITADGLARTIATEREQWLFPAWLAAVHWGAAKTGFVGPHDWGTSAQLAAALPLVLAVAAVYLLWRPLIGRAGAAVSATLLAVLPEIACLGADGLSDSLHLLLASAALACAAACCRSIPVAADAAGDSTTTPIRAWSGLLTALACGLCLGGAVATRAEAWILLPALGLTLAWACLERRDRATTRRTLQTTAAVALGLVAVVAPWLAAAQVTDLPAAKSRLLGLGGLSDLAQLTPLNADVRALQGAALVPTGAWRLADGRPMVFGPKDYAHTIRFDGMAATSLALAAALGRLLAYGVGALAFWGAAARGLCIAQSVDRLLLLTALLLLGATFLVAHQRGYLESRHLALMAPLAVGLAAEGAFDLGQRLARAARALVRGALPLTAAPRLLAALVLALAVAVCLPRLLARQHISRTPHREAASWLSAPHCPQGAVLDTIGLTALETGRITYRGEATAAALCDPQLRFLVLEAAEVDADTPRAHSLRQVLAWGADRVASFAPPAGTSGQQVRIYAWHPHRLAFGPDQHHAR